MVRVEPINPRAAIRDLFEALACFGEDRLLARCLLPAPDGDIDIAGIEFNAAGQPTCSAAIRVDPLPRNGSSTTSLLCVTSSRASTSSGKGFTVG